ncbi:MAG: hypothetical protein J6M20_04590 [Clostridia bacterium]|nr:hypothetical protein [Clostridia bacterium]
MKKFLCLLLAAMMLLGCVPALAEGFPELDSFAAWDYIGDWFGVSGLDVMGDPTTDYPDLKLNLYLNGLGDLYLDGGKKEIVGWYVEDDMVFVARTVDKVPQADQIFAFAAKNETGRLVVDLGYCSVICEQEGEEYLDVTWPAFDAEDAKYFIGTWEAVTYIGDGMELSAELIGPMTLVLKDDGTALSIEGEEEPYELRWYSDYAVAYIGETPTELAEISFDGNGNISVKLDAETTVIMKPVAEVVETGTILGTWESSDKTVEITEDGKLKMVYKSDGYTNHMQWEIIDGMPTVSLGTWKGSTIQFVDGYLIINYSVEQKLTRVGDVPEIYVGPGGFEVPADDASADFLGNWVEDDGRGVLTFNADFTAVMNFTDGRVYDMNWKTTEDGAIFTTGNWFNTAMVIENENTLNIGGGWMILYREGTQDSGNEMPVAQPIGAEGEAYFGTWTMDLGGMAMNLTLNQDGTCAMEMFGESEPGVWSIVDGKANVMGDEIYIDDDGNLVVPAAEMVFTKAGGAASSGTEQPAAAVDYVPSVADDFIGGWICKADPNMQILLLEGEANLIDGGELYTTTWALAEGVAEFDGMKFYITENYSIGILDMYGELVEFERGYVEKPKASAAAPETDDSDEMSDEELLALLALLGQMENSEGGESADLPENLQPYVGTWHMVYMATGGLEGDLRTMGINAKLELNADGTGKLSGAADDAGKWYDDEGQVRFGQAESPLTLLDGGFLRYGSQLAGYMVFSQDANAVWNPAPAATEVPVATAAPAAPAASFDSYEDYMDIKFVATTYTSFGNTMDASTLGAEYSVTFHANGTCEFIMAGINTPGLTWGLQEVAMGLTKAEAFVISYYGVNYNCIPTATGFDMDFYGTMNLHFVPAQ